MKRGICSEIPKERVSESASGRSRGIRAPLTLWHGYKVKHPACLSREFGGPGEMAALSSPGSGPCLSQGVPEVYLFRCQVSSEEICGVFRKKWADNRPGKLRATTATDDLDCTQIWEILQEMFKISNQHRHKGTEIKDRKISSSDPLASLCLLTPEEANVPSMVSTSKPRVIHIRLSLPKISSVPFICEGEVLQCRWTKPMVWCHLKGMLYSLGIPLLSLQCTDSTGLADFIKKKQLALAGSS